jgi:SAM-dependent MidA family methyltransferase
LKAKQAATLANAGIEIAWHESLSDVPAGPLFLVANEFFDALPVRQLVRVDDAWRERVVSLDADGKLAFGAKVFSAADPAALTSPLRGGRSSMDAERERRTSGGGGRRKPIPPPETGGAPLAGFDLPARGRLSRVADGSILELRPSADAIVAEISRRIANEGGAALIVDYGYEGPAFGDTLQAVRGHRFADPLEAPGEVDLTAHVDFSALARAARAEGVAVHGPIPQGDFLTSLGLLARAEKLAASAGERGSATLDAAVERLAGSAAMGTLFKVLALTRQASRRRPSRPMI